MNWPGQIAVLLATAALILQRVSTLLTYFQQEEYDGARFFNAWHNVRLFDIRATLLILLSLVFIGVGIPESVVLLPLASALCLVAYQERQHRYKKPLNWTDRTQRLHCTASTLLITSTIIAYGTTLHLSAYIAAVQIAPLALIAANALLQPFQTRINTAFVCEALTKLKRLNPVRIGITGSFGKTTVKHMLAEILEASGPVFYSPGSINTVLGHTRHIRQRLQWSHQYFIAEMGAYGKGSIARLCEFIGPQFGIITAVGDAHTERFGSIDAIAHAKSELAEAVCAIGGTLAVNADVLHYPPFQRLKAQFANQLISVGWQHSDVTVDAREIAGGSWRVSLHSTDPRIPQVTYELPLIGRHNVINSALAVTLAILIDPSIVERIPFFTKTIAQVPHRLQKLGTPGSALILDDAYNSNEQGFMSAVTQLDKLGKERGGRRILVTPGIAELGLEHDRVHARLGAFCADKCDIVYAINPERIPTFIEGLAASPGVLHAVPTLAAARKAIAEDTRSEDVVLYENDLPDLLEEKRFL